MSLPSEWVSCSVETRVIEEARRLRAVRDTQYGNLFKEQEGDLRWVGEVGEIIFDRWLTSQGIEHVWITKDAAGREDFRIGAVKIGVKTVKRSAKPLANYTAQISARHAAEPIDHFFFACYESVRGDMHLLGGLPKGEFLSRAKYYGEGEFVHPNYQIGSGHAIHKTQIEALAPPCEWLAGLSKYDALSVARSGLLSGLRHGVPRLAPPRTPPNGNLFREVRLRAGLVLPIPHGLAAVSNSASGSPA